MKAKITAVGSSATGPQPNQTEKGSRKDAKVAAKVAKNNLLKNKILRTCFAE